jgi:hypothetical protein
MGWVYAMKQNTKTKPFPPLHLFHSSSTLLLKQSTLCNVTEWDVIHFLPQGHSTTALKVSIGWFLKLRREDRPL